MFPDFRNFDRKRIDGPDVEDNEFKPLIDKIIDSNQSWLINGPPGAGKTFLINEIKKTLTENNKIYKCLAPTNLAALLINGTTIHKFSCKLKKFKSFMEMKLDYLFVDEVSMLHSNFYKTSPSVTHPIVRTGIREIY